MPKRLDGCILRGYMNGAYLRELREANGRKASWVAKRAGYKQPHYSKIEAKDSISVEEFVAVLKAMDLKPGDHLENSIEDVKPVLPLVEVLKRFTPRAHERVRELLNAAAAMLEENLLAATAQSIVRDVGYGAGVQQGYSSGQNSQTDKPREPVATDGGGKSEERSDASQREAARQRQATEKRRERKRR